MFCSYAVGHEFVDVPEKRVLGCFPQAGAGFNVLFDKGLLSKFDHVLDPL